jgi:DNA-binding MarR family transcriptional regulator
MNTKPDREDALTLEILDAVERRSDVSQRHLARHLGVALGLANSYLKRCVRKGLIKIIDAPANRYLYYLTPKGFAEKSRLTARYLKSSLAFYRRAGGSCDRVFVDCRSRDWRRLLLCGVSDLAEIATLRAMDQELSVIGFLDPRLAGRRVLGRPVWGVLEAVEDYDACVLTDLDAPQALYEQLSVAVPPERVLVPDILRIERVAAAD